MRRGLGLGSEGIEGISEGLLAWPWFAYTKFTPKGRRDGGLRS